jgi:hypothetical protein
MAWANCLKSISIFNSFRLSKASLKWETLV